MSATSDAVPSRSPTSATSTTSRSSRSSSRRRHGRGRRSAADARVRQGDDGRAGAGRGRRPRAAREDRRPGLQGVELLTLSPSGDGDAVAAVGRSGSAAKAAEPRLQSAAGRLDRSPRDRRRRPRRPARATAAASPRLPRARANGGGPVYASPPCAGWRASSASTCTRSPAAVARAGSPRRTCSGVRRGRPGRAAGRSPAGGRRGWSGAAAVAAGRLREVRSDRARPALADPADLRAQPSPQLGDDTARHPQRRGRHHRARGVAQAAQRRATARA